MLPALSFSLKSSLDAIVSKFKKFKGTRDWGIEARDSPLTRVEIEIKEVRVDSTFLALSKYLSFFSLKGEGIKPSIKGARFLSTLYSLVRSPL
jgi:hypothetical protein